MAFENNPKGMALMEESGNARKADDNQDKDQGSRKQELIIDNDARYQGQQQPEEWRLFPGMGSCNGPALHEGD